jgi:2-dehydropantoate 2-reductase
MRVAVYGAGAIGGLLGAYLARTDAEVSLIARGPHLAAMRERGLEVRGQESFTVHPHATDDPAELGPQDYVIIALKAHSVPPVVDKMRPLLGPETAVVFAVNGVPWWYFYKLPGPYEDHRLESVDPGNRQWDVIGPERAIGCVVHPAAEVAEPGVIAHETGDRFVLGEPSGESTERVQRLSRLLIEAGLKAPVRPRIRDEIWVKLWGNLALNPLSVLTLSTLDRLAGEPDLRQLVRGMMLEAQAVGEALGVRFAVDVEKRIDGAGEVGAHKTSMLQDLERGRPMEIDALLGAVVELGELTAQPMPLCRAVLALVRERARQAGLYPVA